MAEETRAERLARLGMGITPRHKLMEAAQEQEDDLVQGGLVLGPSAQRAIAEEKRQKRQELQRLRQEEVKGPVSFNRRRRIAHLEAWVAKFDGGT